MCALGSCIGLILEGSHQGNEYHFIRLLGQSMKKIYFTLECSNTFTIVLNSTESNFEIHDKDNKKETIC